jgi:hypothetical protein
MKTFLSFQTFDGGGGREGERERAERPDLVKFCHLGKKYP